MEVDDQARRRRGGPEGTPSQGHGQENRERWRQGTYNREQARQYDRDHWIQAGSSDQTQGDPMDQIHRYIADLLDPRRNARERAIMDRIHELMEEQIRQYNSKGMNDQGGTKERKKTADDHSTWTQAEVAQGRSHEASDSGDEGPWWGGWREEEQSEDLTQQDRDRKGANRKGGRRDDREGRRWLVEETTHTHETPGHHPRNEDREHQAGRRGHWQQLEHHQEPQGRADTEENQPQTQYLDTRENTWTGQHTLPVGAHLSKQYVTLTHPEGGARGEGKLGYTGSRYKTPTDETFMGHSALTWQQRQRSRNLPTADHLGHEPVEEELGYTPMKAQNRGRIEPRARYTHTPHRPVREGERARIGRIWEEMEEDGTITPRHHTTSRSHLHRGTREDIQPNHPRPPPTLGLERDSTPQQPPHPPQHVRIDRETPFHNMHQERETPPTPMSHPHPSRDHDTPIDRYTRTRDIDTITHTTDNNPPSSTLGPQHRTTSRPLEPNQQNTKTWMEEDNYAWRTTDTRVDNHVYRGRTTEGHTNVENRQAPHTREPAHTTKEAMDAETRQTTHLRLAWKAIHAYGKTIPTREWYTYKKQIQDALSITRKYRPQDISQFGNRAGYHPHREEEHNGMDNIETFGSGYRASDYHQRVGDQNTKGGMQVDRQHITINPYTHDPIHSAARHTNDTVAPTTAQPRLEGHTLRQTQTPNDSRVNTLGLGSALSMVNPPITNRVTWADIAARPPPTPLADPSTYKPEAKTRQKTPMTNTIQNPLIGGTTHTTAHTQQASRGDIGKSTLQHGPYTHTLTGNTRQPQQAQDSSTRMESHKDDGTHTRTPTTQKQDHDTALTQAWIWKTRVAQNQLTGEVHRDRDSINHYTNTLAGPPAYLTTSQKARWREAINAVKETCRISILIPALKAKTEEWQARRQATHPTDAEKLEQMDKILDNVWNMWSRKGFSNTEITRIFTQADLNADFIPAPPLPPPPTPPTPTPPPPPPNQSTTEGRQLDNSAQQATYPTTPIVSDTRRAQSLQVTLDSHGVRTVQIPKTTTPTTLTTPGTRQIKHPQTNLDSPEARAIQIGKPTDQNTALVKHITTKPATLAPKTFCRGAAVSPRTLAVYTSPRYAATKSTQKPKTQTQARQSTQELGGYATTLKAPTQLKLMIQRDGKLTKTNSRGTIQALQENTTTNTREQTQDNMHRINLQETTHAKKAPPLSPIRHRPSTSGGKLTIHNGTRASTQSHPLGPDGHRKTQQPQRTSQQVGIELTTATSQTTGTQTEANPPDTETWLEEREHTGIRQTLEIHNKGKASTAHRASLEISKTQSKTNTAHLPLTPTRVDPPFANIPTPIAVGTPKKHHARHGRAPSPHTQVDFHIGRQDMILTPTTKEAIMQIDLTMENTPNVNSTPKTQGAKYTREAEIKSHTPATYVHTPKLHNGERLHSPKAIDAKAILIRAQATTTIGSENATVDGDKSGNPQPTREESHSVETRAQETMRHTTSTPERKTPLSREIVIESQPNPDPTRPRLQNTYNTNSIDTLQPQAYINVDTPTPEASRRTETRETSPINEREQRKGTRNMQDRVAATPPFSPPMEANRHGAEKGGSTAPYINHTHRPADAGPTHETHYEIIEEDWQQLCRETFEGIELLPQKQEIPKPGTRETAKIHSHTQNTHDTSTETSRQRAGSTSESTPGMGGNNIEDTERDRTTHTDADPRQNDGQKTPIQTSQADDTADPLTNQANLRNNQKEETFYQAIERIIREGTHRTGHEDSTNTRTANGAQAHRQASEQLDTGTKERRLKNLKRRYLREQKRVRDGIKQKKKNKVADTGASNTVYDYTTQGLTQAERQVLGLGKTFIITQNDIDIDRIKTDIATFIRRLRLHYIFRERRKDETQRNLDYNRMHRSIHKGQMTQKGLRTQWRKPKSTFQPEETQRDINQIEHDIEINIATQLTNMKRGPPNTPREWMTAIDTLKRRIADKEITITQADKGGGIIVLDYDIYTNKGTKYIEEEAEAYELDYTPEELLVAKLTKEREKVTKKLKELDIIPADTATYATHQVVEKITGMKFYYKIHKTTDIHTMPVRPLQSCIGSPTQHLSQVLTDIYERYINSEYIPTYIRDTNHTLYELDGTKLRETDTLAVADVIALYPSIDHEKGLRAIKEFTREYIHKEDSKAEALTNAFRLVITQNYVKWQGNIYKQKRGVAMGTPVAVTYANIYMNAIDHKIADACTYIKLHRRFIDDNLYIIPSDKKEEFKHALDTIDPPTLRHTVAYLGETPNDTTLPFLDIKFYLNTDRELYTRLYTKDTDKHQYLMPYSQHPRHIIRNIPRGVFARIRRLCKDHQAYMEDSALAVGWLKDRGYKESILNQIREDTGKRDRWQMIRTIEERVRKINDKPTDPTLIPFINTYSTPTKGFSNTIHSQKEALDSIFKKARVKPLNAYRRKQNLGDILMQPSLRIHIEGTNIPPKIFTKCGKHPHKKPCPCTGLHNSTQCRVCAHIDQANVGIKTRINRPITCDSKNVIYMIWCDACGSRYIGETQQKIRDRFTQHLYNLDVQDQIFYNHFKKPGHGAGHMRLAIIETLHTEEPLYRKIKESTWIRKLKTYTPYGLNDKMKDSPLDAIKTQRSQLERGKHTHRNPEGNHPDQDLGDDSTRVATPSMDPNEPTKAHTTAPRQGSHHLADTAIPRASPRHGTQQHVDRVALANPHTTSIPTVHQRRRQVFPGVHGEDTISAHPRSENSSTNRHAQHPLGGINRHRPQPSNEEGQGEEYTFKAPPRFHKPADALEIQRTQPNLGGGEPLARAGLSREKTKPHSQP